MTDKYVNPFTDFGFKKLFGTEVNKELMIDLLNSLIKEQGTITDITYLRNEHMGIAELDRNAIFDIYCENEAGEKFIVEMQKAKQNFFKDRSIYYSTFPIQEQAQKGEWNFELKAIYTIGILDFVFAEDKDSADYYHHHVQLMETSRKKTFYDKLTFIYLEMPKFNKTEDELETHFDKWMYVIKNLARFENKPQKIKERIFERFFKAAEIAKFSKAEMAAYENSLKYYRDMNNVINTSFGDGKAAGIKEAYSDIKNVINTSFGDGEAKGKAEGKAEGFKEAYNRLVQSGISPTKAKQLLRL